MVADVTQARLRISRSGRSTLWSPVLSAQSAGSCSSPASLSITWPSTRVLPLGKRTHVLADSRRDDGTLRVHRPHGGSEGLQPNHVGIALELPGRRGSTTRMARGIRSRRAVPRGGSSIVTDNTYTAEELRTGRRTLALDVTLAIYAQFGLGRSAKERARSRTTTTIRRRRSRSTTQEPGHQASGRADATLKRVRRVILRKVQLRSARELQDFIPSGVCTPTERPTRTSQSIRAIPRLTFRYNSKKRDKAQFFNDEPYWRQPTRSAEGTHATWIVSCSITASKSVLAEDHKENRVNALATYLIKNPDEAMYEYGENLTEPLFWRNHCRCSRSRGKDY